jgi:hypothetical protein
MSGATNQAKEEGAERAGPARLESAADFEQFTYAYAVNGRLPELIDGLCRAIVANCPARFIESDMAARPGAQAALRAYSEWAQSQGGGMATKPSCTPDHGSATGVAAFLRRVWLILREVFTHPFRTTYADVDR